MAEAMTGGCACGRIRYIANVHTDDAYLCHCRMCQRATGSVSVAFKNIGKAEVRWQQQPEYYASSPIARRPYCKECGTSLGFEYPDSDNMDLTIGSFDNPERFRPAHHFGAESMHRAWINTEGLAEYRTDEHKPLVDRWMNVVGKLPS